MTRTCLIFEVQLCAKHLQQIREIFIDLNQFKKELTDEEIVNSIITFTEYDGILDNLQEIILQSKINNFRFNAYILKMVIVKCEYIMSKIQLTEELFAFGIYYKFSKIRIDLICMLDDLISPF